MSTSPVFSRNYYEDPWLFVKGWRIDKTPEGATFTSSLFTDFCGARNLQVYVDHQETLTAVSKNCFENLSDFPQSKNQIAAHRRLKSLETQLLHPLSPQTQLLKKEIRDMGVKGARILQQNLKTLNKSFQESNQKSLLTSTLLKIVNVVRQFFHYSPIEFYDFTPLDLAAFNEKAITPALELTHSDRLRSKYFLSIQNPSPFPLPTVLTQDNLYKLELGLLDHISFSMDQKQFLLTFDKENEEFIFTYSGLENDSAAYEAWLNQYREKSSIYPFPTLNTSEKKLDGTIVQHPLQPSMHSSYDYGSWYNLWATTFQIRVQNASLPMQTNSEYTFPLSQGNLCIKPLRRAQN